MDHLPTLDETRTDGHLTEQAVEALVGERDALLSAAARTHASACPTCAERVALARADAETTSAALRLAFERAALDVDALVARAVVAGAPGAAMTARTPSRRALSLACAVAGPLALVLGALSLDGIPSTADLTHALHRAGALLALGERVAARSVPGGTGALALGLVLLLVGTLAIVRALAGVAGARAATRALAVLGLVALPMGQARALEFEGEWPADEKLTVVADDVPASVALERAAHSAGLGYVGVLAIDPTTHLRVRDASLRDIVTAVLGPDAPFVVERRSALLVVRAVAPSAPVPIAPPSATPTAPPAPPAPAVPAPVTPPPAPERVTWFDSDGDRVSFGGDVIVREGERVESVFALGGEVTVNGEVRGDVVAIGGDVHIGPRAHIEGEIVAIGGETMDARGPGHASAATRATRPPWSERHTDDALEAWIEHALGSGASHALLFLLGLLVLGLAPLRLEVVAAALRARPGRATAIGLLAGFAAIVLGVLLVITIIGIPAALLVALALPLAAYAGLVAVATVIGGSLPLRALDGEPVKQLAAGVAALFVLSLVPFVGDLLGFFAACAGLGAVVLTRAGVATS